MYCLELGPRKHKNESTVELKLLQHTETKCDGGIFMPIHSSERCWPQFSFTEARLLFQQRTTLEWKEPVSPTCVLMAPRTSGMMTWTPKSRSGRRLTCSHALFLLCRSLPLPLHLIPFTKAATPVSFFAQLFNLKSFAFFYFFLPAQSQDPAIPHFSLPPKPPGSQIQLGFHAPLTLLSLLRSDCPV